MGVAAMAAAAVPLVTALGASGLAQDASPRLTTMSGTLERCADRFCMGSTVIDFGPAWYLTAAQVEYDFDRDGRLDTLAEEFSGLVGAHVTLETDGGTLDADVFTVNGLPYRSGDGELPPPRPQPPSEATAEQPDPSGADPGDPVTIRGKLQRCAGEFCVGDLVADFGPHWYLARIRSDHDYDGDGRTGLLVEEFSGLVGNDVILTAEAGPDDADVASVNGLPYRDTGTSSPWKGGPFGRGPDTDTGALPQP